MARGLAGLRLAVTAALAALLLSGCAGGGIQATSSASGRGATIAFESIDGLPQGQFTRLVGFLSEEAKSRELAVVTRDSPSQFRARGYASAQVRGKRTVIAWVWDVYDAQQQRAIRVSGEQPSAAKARGWAAADDQALRNIARESLTQLAGFLANPETAPAAPPEGPSAGTVVASTEPGTPHDSPTLQSLATFGGH
ncbi:MAG: hypothetical protein ACXWJW_09615 [Xanthobacteraceae bacterium]